MTRTVRIATRESQLALWQATHVREQLLAAHPSLKVEIVGMTTEGDRNKVSPLSSIGGKGVFVKELEIALLQGDADIAVHSMKDVPGILPEGLAITAVCEREDPRDAFISNNHNSPGDIPAGGRIGSSSLRRRIQLQKVFPDLDYLELRGNVDTRLKKLDQGEYEGIILACAGLVRLGLADRISERISATVSIPAAGQGAVGVESRIDDNEMTELLSAIDHQATSLCVGTERRVTQVLEATCNLPIGVFATIENNLLHLDSFVSDLQGSQTLKIRESGPLDDSTLLADKVAQALLDSGASELINSA